MAAIVSDFLKQKLVNYLYDEITNSTDSNEYYIGIGKSDVYDSATDTVVDPVRTDRESRLARLNLQAIKKVSLTSFAATRTNWSAGTIYPAWSDSRVGIPSIAHYAFTEENHVYLCLRQGTNATGAAVTSTVKPNYTTAGVAKHKAFATSDGYIWKYLYEIDATGASNFLSSNFLPTQFSVLTDSSGDNTLTNARRFQAAVRENAIGGQIPSTIVQAGGSGYTSAPTVTINGNGSNAAATATVSGGQVVKVEMNNESAAFGSGYDYASITLSGGGGSGAIVRPVIGPKLGFGFDATEDMKSSSIMCVAKLTGEEGNDFIIGQDFRQIVLMRNIEKGDSASVDSAHFTGTTANALRFVTLSALTTPFTKDNKIVGATSGAEAFIDNTDSNGSGTEQVFYHQNETTGFKAFQDGENLTETGGSGAGTIDSASPNLAVDTFSGDVLYVENRGAITRSANQTEDIKVIITV